MRIVRWFFGLLVLAGLAFGAAYYFAGKSDGPAITINQPSIIGQGGTLDVTVDAPGGEITALNIQLEQKGRTFPVFDLASAPAGTAVTQGDRVRVTAADRQENPSGAGKRTGDTSSQRLPARLPQTAAGLVGVVAGSSGAADAAASGGHLDAPLRQSGRRGNGRVSRDAAGRRVGRACRRLHLSRLPGCGCRTCRPRAEGGVLRSALQPDAGRADGGLRARRRGQ